MKNKHILLRVKRGVRERISKEFVITIFGQFIYLSQNVIQNKIFASFFTLELFGEWSLLVSVYTLVSMLPFSALDQGIYRISSFCKENETEKQMYSIIGIFYFVGFALYTLVFIVVKNIQNNNFFAKDYLALFLLYTFTEIIKNTYVLIDNAYRNRIRVLFIRLFGITSRTILFFLAYMLNRFTINSVLFILVLTNIFILLYQRRYICGITFNFDKEICKNIISSVLNFSTPLLTWAVFGWMQNMISRWYLDALLDKTMVAMYTVLSTISFFFPNAVYTILNAYVMPIVFSNNKSINRSSLLKYVGMVGAVLICYWIGIVLFGKYLIVLLSDFKYSSIYNFLPLTTMSSIIYVLAMLSTIEIYRRGETRKLIIPTIIPGLFMATIGFFLIKYFGFNGAIINYVLGHIIYAVFTFSVVFNKNNIQ